MENMHGALENLVVLDLTRVVAGPYCGAILGDMGARVIKIENPKGGDDSRFFPPQVNGESAYYALHNRSKEGITLNFKEPEAKEIFKKLVAKVDILIENYRPGVMDKLGLGYDVLKEINPQLIYAAVSGYGCYGRYSQRPGYDILGQAMGGLMTVTGQPGSIPTKAGNAMGDVLGGLNLTIGILAAVNARSIIGHGQRVDVSLVDAVVHSLENVFTRYRYSGKEPKLQGNANPACSPYNTFTCKDALIVIACGNQGLYEKLVKVMDMPELLTDPRFVTNIDRVKNYKEIKEVIDAWCMNYNCQELTDILLKNGVPAGPVYTIDMIINDPHIAIDRDMFPTVHHPVIGDMKLNGDAIKLMDTMPHITKPAPLLGEDNQKIIGEELGYNAETLAEYKTRGII